MKTRLFTVLLTGLFVSMTVIGQRTPPPQPRHPGAFGPPRDGQTRPGGGMHLPGRGPQDDWMKRLDTNEDGKLDAAELKASMDNSFTTWDKDGNGVIEPGEMPRPPRGHQPPDGRGTPQAPPIVQGFRIDGSQPQGSPRPNDGNMLPPFFFADRSSDGGAISRADFERIVKGVFSEMDTDGDGAISRGESHPPKREDDAPGGFQAPMPPPNAQFIGNELRFGDKQVTGQPFSAETVIEDTRRLYDGSTVTKQNRGAIYRDGAGRTRLEQPLEMVGGVNITGANNKSVVLIFINDFTSKTQISLDHNNKIARKSQIWSDNLPFREGREPRESKTEGLGTKIIEGVAVEGTRTTFEIPAGQFGNTKPIQVVDEKWFSSELQLLVMSRHLDPVNGEHVFKLVNIKRSEPVADMFTIPAGYRLETRPGMRHEKE